MPIKAPSRLRVPADAAPDFVDLAAKLGPEKAILLVGGGAHSHHRWNLLGLMPDARIQAWGNGHIETEGVDDAMEDLLSWPACPAAIPPPDDAPFQSGWAGVLGYELALHIHGFEVPDDALLLDIRRYRAVLAQDTRRKRIFLYAADTDSLFAARALLDDVDPHVDATAEERTWTTLWDKPSYMAACQEIQRWIRKGDHYQSNLALQHVSEGTPFDPYGALRALQASNPGPYMGLAGFGKATVLSNSPELLVRRRGGRIEARPIAGTRRRRQEPEIDAARIEELRTSSKEQAEHRMLVDLLRNDLAQVCEPGSVEVPESAAVELYANVMHLTSAVCGKDRGAAHAEILRALFPGGTITGAPKLRSMQRIQALEPTLRGPYTGAMGFLDDSGDCTWNILIRTIVQIGDSLSIHAGAGIVIDGDPSAEYDESMGKARALLAIASGQEIPPTPRRLGEVLPSNSWQEPDDRRRFNAQVLLVDHDDSFTHNIAEYLRKLGASVEVRNHKDLPAKPQATHLVLSPGPGAPEDYPHVQAYLEAFAGPVLGICLGHQMMAHATGAKVVEHHEVIHGKTSDLHEAKGFLQGFQGTPVARYHSLTVDPTSLQPHHETVASLHDGTIMALHYQLKPWWSLQFHPESMGTPNGLRMLARFLEQEQSAQEGEAP